MKNFLRTVPKNFLTVLIILAVCLVTFAIRSLIVYFGCINESSINPQWELVYWTFALTISTIFLGIVAALQDIIRKWFTKPVLDCELSVEPPHCHRATTVKSIYQRDPANIPILKRIDTWFTYYFRFKIWNRGNISAKNVEVILREVKNDNGLPTGLSPDNLVWSTLEFEANNQLKQKMYWDYISPKTYQYCNLGYIDEPTKRKLSDEYKDYEITIDSSQSIFGFSIYWKTFDKKHLNIPGIYSFEIIVGCENAKTITKKYKIDITGFWSNNEEEMLKKGLIKISED